MRRREFLDLLFAAEEALSGERRPSWALGLVPISWPDLAVRAEADLRPETKAFVNILAALGEDHLPKILKEKITTPWKSV